MDKEKILSQNKKENLYLDEYEKHIKLQGKSFGLMFVLFICILILFIKAVCKEPYYDIMTIIGSVAFGSMGYEAHISKNKSKFVIALFFFLFMGYYFYKFLMVGLQNGRTFNFAKQIKNCTKRKKLSQTELAELVGVSRNTVSSIETGQFNPTAKLALVLCIALDKKFEELFYFD